jgi:hypothetical protein
MSDITWTNEKRKLGILVPWKRNPRQIKKAEGKRLAESLDTFGQIHPIAIGPDDEIYDGHQRQLVWSALDRYGADFEVDVRVSSRALTEKEREQLVVFLHRGTVAEWDWDVLANEFEVGDLLEWGFSDAELGLAGLDLSGDEPLADPGPQVDRASELQEKWQVKTGQIWELGRHKLVCGDSMALDFDVLFGEIKLVLTDPPYGISIVSGLRSTIGGSKPVTIGTIRSRRTDTVGGVKNVRGTVGTSNMVNATPYRPVQGDDKPFDPRPLLDIGDNQIIFGGNYFASRLPDSRCWIVWDKNNTGNFADAELAWTSFDRSVKLYQYTWNGLLREGSRQLEGAKRMHPTQKPAGLFSNILSDFSQDGDVIIDPYLGSGTTIIACEVTGRIGLGIEIDPAYCATTIERWHQMTGEQPRIVEQL